MELLHFVSFDHDEKEVIRESFEQIESNYPVGFNILSNSNVSLSFVHDGIKCFDDAIEELNSPKKARPSRAAARQASPEERSKKIQEGLNLLRRAADMVEDFAAGCLDDVQFN